MDSTSSSRRPSFDLDVTLFTTKGADQLTDPDDQYTLHPASRAKHPGRSVSYTPSTPQTAAQAGPSLTALRSELVNPDVSPARPLAAFDSLSSPLRPVVPVSVPRQLMDAPVMQREGKSPPPSPTSSIASESVEPLPDDDGVGLGEGRFLPSDPVASNAEDQVPSAPSDNPVVFATRDSELIEGVEFAIEVHPLPEGQDASGAPRRAQWLQGLSGGWAAFRARVPEVPRAYWGAAMGLTSGLALLGSSMAVMATENGSADPQAVESQVRPLAIAGIFMTVFGTAGGYHVGERQDQLRQAQPAPRSGDKTLHR